MAEYATALSYFVDESRVFIGQNSHSAIVVHGTGGDPVQTAQQLGDYFASTSFMTSSHYGIDRSGVVCQYVMEGDGAAANCCVEAKHDPFWDQFGADNLNVHTLSIEHINDSTNSLALTAAQQSASFKLITYLCKKYGIPASNVKSHASIAPQSRAACPGPAYPWDALWAYLKQQGNAVNTPSQYQAVDAATEWASTASLFPGNKAPSYATGIAVAWRSRVYQGSRMGPPLTAEYASTDWSGNAIKVQQFSNARCEWSIATSAARWFDARGEIL